MKNLLELTHLQLQLFSDAAQTQNTADAMEILQRQIDDNVNLRYIQLVNICKLNAPARLVLNLSLLFLVRPDLLLLLKKAFGQPDLTIQTAANMLFCEDDFAQMRSAYNQAALLLTPSKAGKPFFATPLFADERLLEFLNGADSCDSRIESTAHLFNSSQSLNPVYTKQAFVQHLINQITCCVKTGAVMHLSGNEGCGKRFYLKHALKALKIDALFVDCDVLFKTEGDIRTSAIFSIRRELLMDEKALCLYNCKKEYLSDYFLNVFLKLGITVCILSDGTAQPSAILRAHVLNVAVPPYTVSDLMLLWQGYCKENHVEQDYGQLAEKYRLSPKQIKKAAYILSQNTTENNLSVAQACRLVMPIDTLGSIKKIDAPYTAADLKLPEEQMSVLNDLCAHITCRSLVYNKWGMAEKYYYGTGVSAIFTGQPGTGKTMAANVIGNMLGLEVYRVDLSQVIDKYIGETEKRLEQIFSLAQNSNMILLFDEADAIFGKRTEVKEAKDKYANVETSYILQRIEEYDGIVILSTNYYENIDKAFLRRIRYVVHFPLPGPEVRLEIWRSSIPKSLPISSIDYDYLANSFQLSGGAIKNILLNAVFLAAKQNEPLHMKHIIKSIQRENIKIGKINMQSEFGDYAHYIE